MKTENTLRQGETAEMATWTKDALRSAEANDCVPYDRASLPGEKQKRYGAAEFVSLVLMDMFRGQGLSNSDASFAASGSLEVISMRLFATETDEQAEPHRFAYSCIRQVSAPNGALMRDIKVGCETIEPLSTQFADWAKGVDLAQDAMAIKSGFVWVHSGPSLHVVSIENAVQHARKLARAKGYTIEGKGFFPIATGQE